LSANQAYLLHVQIAYNLAIFFKLLAAPNGVNRWTIETIRARLLCVCGNLRRRAGRWILSLPAWWPYQTVFRQLMRRCDAAFA
ncbi:MAG: transposase, partial [Planctomycetota bacterium]